MASFPIWSVIANRKDVIGQQYWSEWRIDAVSTGGTVAQAGNVVLLGPDGKIDPSLLPSTSSVSVNGTAVTDPNFNNATPAAPTGYTNVIWQVDGAGNVSAYYATSGTTVPFGEITTGTNTTATMTVSGTAAIEYGGTGVVNANEVGGINVAVNAPTHEGQILISQPGNASAAWADPQVQGLYPDGSSIASPPAYALPTTIQPVYVGGQGADGNLHGIKVANDGTVQVSGSLSVTFPTTQDVRIPDQSVTGTITSTESVVLPINGFGNARIVITGTWTGNLEFEQTIDGTHWSPISWAPTGVINTSSPLVLRTSVNGSWSSRAAGIKQLRVRGNSVTSGTATVTLNGSAGTDYVLANVVDDGWIDSNNTTYTPLAAGATFTGVSQDMLPFTALEIWISSDQNSAVEGVSIQFSPDNVHWYTEQQYTIFANVHQHVYLGRRARYYRVSYTNGAVAQTNFQLVCILQRIASTQNLVALDEPVTEADTGILTRSVITGVNPTGTFGNVGLSAQNALSVSGSGTSTTNAAVWNSTTPLNTAVTVLSNNYNNNTVTVGIVTTSTLTQGAITFEASIDNTNWIGLFGLDAGTGLSLTSAAWTITPSTTKAFVFNVTGFNYFRYRLSTAINGTGTVTTSWLTQGLSSPNVVTNISSNNIHVNSDQGSPNTLANAWPVKISDGLNVLGVSANPLVVNGSVTVSNFPATQPISGSVTVANLPLPLVFKTATATAAGNTAVWTPTAGKKFRLQRVIVYVTLNATLTVAGMETITFYDGTTPMPLAFDVYMNQTGSFTEAWTSGWLDLGNGIGSSTADNVLNVNLSTVLATGNIRVVVCGVEE